MIPNDISITHVDTSTEYFLNMVRALSRDFEIHSSAQTDSLTGHSAFIRLHDITSTFYRSEFPHIWSDYLPLYHSIWRQELGRPPLVDNIHQDRTVFHFGREGYIARMVNLWVAIEKDVPESVSDEELGIFIVESSKPVNSGLYARLIENESHFMLKRDGQFIDNTYIGGPIVKFDASVLMRRNFAYSKGTAIAFNSHLLHGSKRFDSSKLNSDLKGSRLALTSVWVHKDDFNKDILRMTAEDYDELYLSKLDNEMRIALKAAFPRECADEADAIGYISSLVKHHMVTNA